MSNPGSCLSVGCQRSRSYHFQLPNGHWCATAPTTRDMCTKFTEQRLYQHHRSFQRRGSCQSSRWHVQRSRGHHGGDGKALDGAVHTQFGHQISGLHATSIQHLRLVIYAVCACGSGYHAWAMRQTTLMLFKDGIHAARRLISHDQRLPHHAAVSRVCLFGCWPCSNLQATTRSRKCTACLALLPWKRVFTRVLAEGLLSLHTLVTSYYCILCFHVIYLSCFNDCNVQH